MIKRQLLFLLAIMSVATGIHAQVRNEQNARQIANQFFKQLDDAQSQTSVHHRNLKTARVESISITDTNGESPAFYIYNRGTDDGFVIVSGDERTTATVLAYSDHGSFDATSMPDNVRGWLNDYASQIAAVRNSAIKGTGVKQLNFPKGNPIVEPLITTQWNQDAPYNDNTPKMSGAHTPVGCMAVAMAQIMNYHRWPEQGTGNIEYQWNNSYLDRDFTECTYDWDNLDVAKLMSDVGIACKMNYGVNSSSAYGIDAGRAFVRYFGYDKAMEYHVRHQLDVYDWNDAEWEKMLRDELNARRPILYTGSKRDGRFYIGHAFVCDGYDDAGYFHFNFGWGGTDDGWYRVTPVEEDYTDINEYQAYHSVFTHLQKDAGNPAWMNIIYTEWQEMMYTYTSDYAETAYKFVNTATGDVYYSESVEFALNSTDYTNLWNVGESGLYKGEIRDDYVKVHDMPDGTYKRYAVYRPKGSDVWQERNFNYCNANKKLAEEYVWVDMKDGNMTVSPSLSFIIDKWYYARVSEDEVALTAMPSYQDSRIDSLVIPDTVEYRGMKYAVTDIDVSYFHDYPTLTLPKNLRTITQLKNSSPKLEIPSSVEKILYLDVSNVTDLVLPSSLKYIGEPGKTSVLRCGNTELTIPEGVVHVQNLNGNKFETVNIPASLQTLGEGCMRSMSDLKTVTFAPGCRLRELPKNCFMLSNRLKNIVLPDGLERIGAESFEGCGSLKEIAIPANVKRIDAGAFSGCTNLEHIAFAEDSKLEIIDGGQYEYNGTFFGCENLEYIEFPASLKVFKDCFQRCGIVYADFSKTQITELDKEWGIFNGCHALETVMLPPTLKTVGNMFQDCEKLTSVVIPEGTEEIGGVFAPNLQSLIIPASVKTLGGLTSNAPTVVCEGMTPPEGEGLADYIYASSLRHFTLYVPAGALQAYKDYEFKFGRYNHIYRIMVPIYEMANNSNANIVADAESATVMGSIVEGALVLPSTVSGTNGEVPVTEIAANAFMGNAGITSVDIPASIKAPVATAKSVQHRTTRNTAGASGIGEYAFAYCLNLDTVHVHWTSPENIDETVFKGINLSDLVLVVPYNTTSDYATSSVWKNFGTIIEETALGIDSPINEPSAISAFDTPTYDLIGRRVNEVHPGIYIRNGKKLLVK